MFLKVLYVDEIKEKKNCSYHYLKKNSIDRKKERKCH